MFFDSDRINFMREMILANGEKERKNYQSLSLIKKEDFKKIFSIMEGFTGNYNLLYPPITLFLPKIDDDNSELLKVTGITQEELKIRVEQLQELNPMLGHRGSRLI